MSPPRRYPVPAAAVRVEERIEHSRFITTLEFAGTIDEAKATIERIRAEFPDATHHCFAYVIGPPGSTSMTGAGDDGEPAGTAGRPMLKVLLNSGVGDVVGVVTRWFGGVKLGTGGLVRAYGGGVQRALREVNARERVDLIDARVTLEYHVLDSVRRALGREGVVIIGEIFERDVALSLRVPEDRIEEVNRALADLTNGAVQLER